MGTRGGDTVTRRLRKLGPDWSALDDPRDTSLHLRFSHLVVGRPGLFAITVPDGYDPSRGRRLGRGAPANTVFAVAAHQAYVVSRRLSRVAGRDLKTWPVVVVGGVPLDIRKESGDVYVVAEPLLVPWLKSLVPIYDDDTLALLQEHAVATATWAGGA